MNIFISLRDGWQDGPGEGIELREAKKRSGSTYRFHQALPWENKYERRKARSKQSTVP